MPGKIQYVFYCVWGYIPVLALIPLVVYKTFVCNEVASGIMKEKHSRIRCMKPKSMNVYDTCQHTT